MANKKLVGENYSTPELSAKVTGRAKYAEDYRAEGMLFARLVLSPYAHARIKRIDASAALAMPGVRAILTPDDVPGPKDQINDNGTVIRANPRSETALANEAMYQGQPVLAVCAESEFIAAEAIERIKIYWEPLPFNVDPVASLVPGAQNARVEGNVWKRPVPVQGQPPGIPEPADVKWNEAEVAEFRQGRLPVSTFTDPEWKLGDVDEGFKKAALIVDETFVSANVSHQCLESRTAMAYWQNGKLHIHTSTQGVAQAVFSFVRWLDLKPEDVVLVNAYTGGGYGSKGGGSITDIIPALLSKKLNGAPVMMRISREEEHAIGRARPAMHGRLKVGFTKEGRVTAVDMFTVTEGGPFGPGGDGNTASVYASLLYQPETFRYRGITAITNTPPRGALTQPGGFQGCVLMDQIVTKAARQLSVDQVAIRKLNAPEGKAKFGPANARGERGYVTSCFIKEALDKGAARFNWNERVAAGVQRKGSKVRGVGVGISSYSGGSVGFDGLFVIRPDGILQVHTGIGNLGTESFSDCQRVAAEMVGMPWEKVEIVWGDTSLHLPWSCNSGGSQTIHAMTRAAHAAATDAISKLQQIAAKDLGGKPEDYEVGGERVYRKGGGRGMTLAQAAKRAIELGGNYDGHELPKDINAMTIRSATALAGKGLMGVGKDNYKHDGTTRSFSAAFAEVEVDIETGKYTVTEFLSVADVGVVIHPTALGAQVLGRSNLGIAHAIGHRWVYDQRYGVGLARRFYNNSPPTILDIPLNTAWDSVGLPDPETPVGARGIGEPPVAAACASVLNAISDALGDEVFVRAPVMLDHIITALDTKKLGQFPLTANV
jgi:xanthine dehydrogenase molybdenum-binding subunit